MHCKRTMTTAATAAALTIGGTAIAAAAEHAVAPGDTLSEIAGSYSGDWQDVYAANRDVIGADPDLIYPGQVLTIGGGAQVTAQSAPAPEPAVTVSLPVDDYTLTARFGATGPYWSSSHTGLDFASPCGSPVRAVSDGVVTSQSWAGAYGNQATVDHGDSESRYAHLSQYGAAGPVDAGDVIGYVGTTGNSTGCHLHLEVVQGGQHIDPYTYLRNQGATP